MLFKTLVLTVLTYFMVRSGATFREISDTFANNQIAFYGLGSGIFLLFLLQMNPLAIVTRSEVLNPYEFQQNFLPGFLRGCFLALLLMVPFLLIGSHHFVGILIQDENVFFSLVTIFVRLSALLILVYCEEFIFRYQWFQMGSQNQATSPLMAVAMSAALYSLSKSIQFQLGISQVLTMLLAGTYLGLRAATELTFTQGAGLWSGFLLFSHIVLSTPLFGNESQGLFFFQYNALRAWDANLSRVITGGNAGPLSSLALQFGLGLGILYEIWRNHKSLFSNQMNRLR
jgi:hypothetical protein